MSQTLGVTSIAGSGKVFDSGLVRSRVIEDSELEVWGKSVRKALNLDIRSLSRIGVGQLGRMRKEWLKRVLRRRQEEVLLGVWRQGCQHPQ